MHDVKSKLHFNCILKMMYYKIDKIYAYLLLQMQQVGRGSWGKMGKFLD